MNQTNTNWKLKVQDLLSSAQSEIKRTTAIGKKMLSATAANTHLHHAYENLGKIAVICMEQKTNLWEDENAVTLWEEIIRLEGELKAFENDVHKIKSE